MNFMKFLIYYSFLFSLDPIFAYSTFFNHWHCLGVKKKLNLGEKPYSINVGDLPLVIWEQKGKLVSTIGICKHMGSILDNNSEITFQGCLKCPYHGLEYSAKDQFGEITEHEGKLFWSYSPTTKNPPSVPFFNNPQFATSFLEIVMEGSLQDSAYNTMDIRHPEFVHSLGFGNSIPPQNIKHHFYSSNKIGLSFDYPANPLIRKLNRIDKNIVCTKNFHMFEYPSFSWSKVTFGEKHLIMGVHLCPLAEKKTKWTLTICHNYYQDELGQKLIQSLAKIILSQDFIQMQNQSPENVLKNTLMFQHMFENEEAVLSIKEMFNKNYQYPDLKECAFLIKESQHKHK